MTYDVVVVGAGFSAIAVTIHLLRELPSACSIAVVGDDPGFGRGAAYRSEFFLHRLNVPAGRMSLFPDQPDDFVEWLRRRHGRVSAEDFAARGDYGLYLRDTLAALLRERSRRTRLDLVKAKATACIRRNERGALFRLDSGDELEGKFVVLCLGLGNAGLPVPGGRMGPHARSRVVSNPWKFDWLSRIGPADEICILGSGLTMVDQVLTLRAQGHEGRIHVLSRRGLIPHSHALRRPAPVTPVLPDPPDRLSDVLRALRRQVRAGADWRALMDGLRPLTQGLWQSLPKSERSRFLRHGLAWWNIHRHRIAPEVFSRFDALVREGVVLVHAGYLREIADRPDSARIVYRRRARHETASFDVRWIVNCTGMERAGIAHSPLLEEMRARGMIAPDELGLGLSVDRQSHLFDASGNIQARLFAVGALTAGQFWEITAVPDIRTQAQSVAGLVATQLNAEASKAERDR
ncbi:MAG: FAD/NAD(P)-binding protein [Shinella sp.]|nr:FAD/NAD(P)-binding protein [Shinella sp.]